MSTRAVLWDLGNVLLDWSPAYLYRKVFETEAEVEHFLANICTMDWHAAHDRGVSMAENRKPLIDRHPEFESAIHAWEGRFPEMLNGPIAGTVEVMEALDQHDVPQYALTNLPAEWVEPVHQLFPSMSLMRDVIVSAHEGVIKPDPRIYQITADRLPHAPDEVIFFDDRQDNVDAARAFGFDAERFTGAPQLVAALKDRKLLP